MRVLIGDVQPSHHRHGLTAENAVAKVKAQFNAAPVATSNPAAKPV